jgi:hypothetical protein
VEVRVDDDEEETRFSDHLVFSLCLLLFLSSSLVVFFSFVQFIRAVEFLRIFFVQNSEKRAREKCGVEVGRSEKEGIGSVCCLEAL